MRKGAHGELVNEMMQPHEHAVVPSLGSMARSQINPMDSCQCSTPELRAQFNLTEKPKRN